jgi:F-type H+-transporting ATPase subunit gamma
VLASRAYAEKAWEILLNVQKSAQKGPALHPLLTPREEIKKVKVILITSERGLAGAYNTNMIRTAKRFGERLALPIEYVTVGRKGRDSMVRVRENVVAEFPNRDNPTIMDVSPIASIAIQEFLSGAVDEVFIAYTDFINTLTQAPRVLQLLPLMPYETDDKVVSEMLKAAPKVTSTVSDYEYEPNANAILDEIVPRFTTLQLYQAVLEAQASEHSARMVAMRNASENAGALTVDLTLQYNKARQAAITSEILDIVGGAEALQGEIDKVADMIEKSMAAEAVR